MTTPADTLVLIGPMGAGKTSIGKRVARALGVGFYDSDAGRMLVRWAFCKRPEMIQEALGRLAAADLHA